MSRQMPGTRNRRRAHSVLHGKTPYSLYGFGRDGCLDREIHPIPFRQHFLI
jgi:hypothetical protein